MKELITSFPDQLEHAVQIAQNLSLKDSTHPINAVLIAGLGGAGIAGTIVSDWLRFHASIPVLTTKDYDLPAWVDQHTLVIACSYSGNTEETLAVFQKASQTRAHLVAVTSGGKLQEMAEVLSADCVLLPGGMPPRACIGYSFVQLLAVLAGHQIISASYTEEIKEIISLLHTHQLQMQQEAKSLAQSILGKHIVIYAASDKEGMAIRFRQQLNENSKVLCHHHVVPEMNHNELVGRIPHNQNYAIIRLRTTSDHERTSYRIDINKELISQSTHKQYEIRAQGTTYLQHIRYLIHLTDRISIYLADLEGVDATEVPIVSTLKDALSKEKSTQI